MSQQPVYLQVREWLMSQIESGELPEESLLPPEQELATRLGVSRPTVRQAMLELVRDGVIARERGKGTTVLGRRLQYPVRRLVSFSEEHAGRGQELTARVLKSELAVADSSLASRLLVQPGSPAFFLSRLRCVNGEVVAWQRAYIPAQYAPGIEHIDFGRLSLYATLADRFGFKPKYADEVIAIGRATREEAGLLAMRRGGPVFRIERRTYLSPARLLEVVEAVYRGDRYEIRLRLTR